MTSTVVRVMVTFGTRPEAIKLAPVVRALRGATWCDPVIVVTGQHREMLQQVLQHFEIVPDFDLGLFAHGQSVSDLTARAVVVLGDILATTRPDMTVVQGDTTTTFAAALASFYATTPVAHVEAGLRTNDPRSPYPEEMNRRLTSALTSLHLAATPLARDNLLREGVSATAIAVTGNTVIDAVQQVLSAPRPAQTAVDGLVRSGRRILLVTAHRRESWGEGLSAVGRALRRIAELRPDVEIVFPIHLNPTVRASFGPEVSGLDNVHVIEPLDYLQFAWLLHDSYLVLTDSGGIQEEAPALGRPVLVMRENTERPEAVSAGTARLVGVTAERIIESTLQLLDDRTAYAAMATAVSPFGDGNASARIASAIGGFWSRAERLDDFEPGGNVNLRPA